MILGKGETLSGRLVIYDAMRMRFNEVKLNKRPDAPPITELIDYQGFCGGGGSASAAGADEAFGRISVAEARAKLDAGWAPFVLDVRSSAEADIVSLPFVNLQQPHRQECICGPPASASASGPDSASESESTGSAHRVSSTARPRYPRPLQDRHHSYTTSYVTHTCLYPLVFRMHPIVPIPSLAPSQASARPLRARPYRP